MKLHRRTQTTSICDALNDVADALRSGSSLRQAITSTAGEGSPLAGVASALVAGEPLASALRAAAEASALRRDDAGASSALALLAVHAEAGGDPLPAVRSLVDAMQRRATAQDEARALTTQARLGARAILLLTPAFLLFVALTDPHGMLRSLADPRTRVAIAAGVALQGLGAWWISTIVSRASGDSSRFGELPFVRVLYSIAAGRPRSRITTDIATCAETIAFALDAGLAPPAAVRAIAPYAAGSFGEALRIAASTVHVPLHRALDELALVIGGDQSTRFARAFERSATLGVPLAPALRSLAGDIRSNASIELASDVRRASVRVLVPLSILVLPAFVLACLVPLFVGGLRQVAG